MKQYNVTGMSCAACSSRVEKAVSKLDGVDYCSVSLLTNSMSVQGDVPDETVIKAVEQAGYSASLKGEEKLNSDDKNIDNSSTEIAVLLKRAAASALLLIVLMYFSMGHMMWGFPIPQILENNHIAMGLIQLLLTSAIMVINQSFFINGFKAVLKKSANMDTLVALGSSAAFVYSVCVLFAMTGAQLDGDTAQVMSYMHQMYFESAAMILALITIGKLLEARSKGKTTDALKSLIRLSPKTAVIIADGKEVKVTADKVKKGDIFVVRPGESIPVDGVVIDGVTAVDESAITGESIPADKFSGNDVFAGTVNQHGFIKCRASKVGEDTTLSQIIKTVSDAAATKAPIARVADKVAGVFVPVVILIAVLTAIIWLLAGADTGFALARAISVLVISCPCSLGLATPVAIMAGSGVGAKNSILFRTAQSLELCGKVKVVAIDKTGTITKGEPNVTDTVVIDSSLEELIKTALTLESKSEHPLAKAIVKKADEQGFVPEKAEDFKSFPGLGVSAKTDGEVICGGNLKFISQYARISQKTAEIAEKFANDGKTPIFFSKSGRTLGVIGVADEIKEDSASAVKQLHDMGMRVVMLTGDNPKTANAVGKAAGVDEVFAGVLPQEKEKFVSDLKKDGTVAMVGDGINDAPALTSADVGIAIGAGTDIALDAADVVLIKSRLSDVCAAIRLGRSTLKIIHENLFWAFFYNVIGIPIAAGAFIFVTGWSLSPMLAAAAMSISSFCVVTNALRLNFVKIHNGKTKLKGSNKPKFGKDEKKMTKTLKIEGMMCPHCEARVKKSLEEIEGVENACVSHEKGNAVVTLNKDVSCEVLKKAVEDQGYTVLL